jgi:hypothetical protein
MFKKQWQLLPLRVQIIKQNPFCVQPEFPRLAFFHPVMGEKSVSGVWTAGGLVNTSISSLARPSKTSTQGGQGPLLELEVSAATATSSTGYRHSRSRGALRRQWRLNILHTLLFPCHPATALTFKGYFVNKSCKGGIRLDQSRDPLHKFSPEKYEDHKTIADGWHTIVRETNSSQITQLTNYE